MCVAFPNDLNSSTTADDFHRLEEALLIMYPSRTRLLIFLHYSPIPPQRYYADRFCSYISQLQTPTPYQDIEMDLTADKLEEVSIREYLIRYDSLKDYHVAIKSYINSFINGRRQWHL